MKDLSIIVTLFLICSIILSCENNDMENKLRERIAGVYQAYKERDFEKFLNFRLATYEQKENREEILAGMTKEYPPVLVDYKIREIKIDKDTARVNVIITLMIKNKKDVSDSFDYWIFKNNEWYLLDFGKIQ